LNYLAHSLRFLADDDPHRLAGASLPDWLRVLDRRARHTPAVLDAHPPATLIEARLDEGVRAHHADDHRFHTLARFEQITDELVKEVRALSSDPRFRASTVGHVLTEMLLDSALLEQDPQRGERYYAALERIDVALMAAFARARTGRSLEHVPVLLERFRRARFLFDYLEDDGVRYAMNGVMRRTGLPEVPRGFDEVVGRARPKVREAAADLLI
jgi:hypothetical protein